MKKILAILLALTVLSCKSGKTPKNEPEAITSELLRETVSYLASDDLQGRDTGSAGIVKAANFLETTLKQYGIKPYFNTYQDHYAIDEIETYNIVAAIEGTDPKLKNEWVVLGAHFDHIGFGKKVGNDSIANGANDNASGTAAVLALAQYFAQVKNNKRSILISFFSGEEKGLKGSKHLAERLKTKNMDVYTVLNFEMIGVPFTGRDYIAFVTGFERSNFSEKINAYTNSKLTGFSEVSKKHNLFKFSDNYPFYTVFKIPSHTISTCDLSNYNFYHHVGDEADKMDYVHMASVVNKIIPAIQKICNTPEKEIQMYHE
ncbi:MAG: M28 family peptidase [Aestuariibaculum sp.]